MEKYQRILVVVNSSQSTCQKLIETAKSLAADGDAQIRLIYILRSTYGAALNFKLKEAKQTLNKLGVQFGIPRVELKLCIGRPKSAMFKEAEKIHSDLLVLGNARQVSDMRLLSGKSCKVLSVRVGKPASRTPRLAWNLSPLF